MADDKQVSERFDFGPTLWKSANKMRGKMDASQYKFLTIPLLWLKYVSDSFDNRELMITSGWTKLREFEEGGRYWVPSGAHWDDVADWSPPKDKDTGEAETLGDFIAEALDLLAGEKTEAVKNAYTSFARAYRDLDKVSDRVLKSVVELFNKEPKKGGLPDFYADGAGASLDLLGYVYEFWLGKLSELEKRGGEYYTPKTVVRLMVDMLEPFDGDIYDGCCGTGGMFFKSSKLVDHFRENDEYTIFGQESARWTWACAVLNVEYRMGGKNFNLGESNEDTLLFPLHQKQKVGYVITNPPFNLKDWEPTEEHFQDERWLKGLSVEKKNGVKEDVQPITNSNANFAWIQHYLHQLNPQGRAGIVLSNGSLSSKKKEEGTVRERIITDDKLDCVIALPDKLFTNAALTACIWFLANDKTDPRYRERSRETLFIDCRDMGRMVGRKLRELSDEDIEKISTTYQNWMSEDNYSNYEDERGFCKEVNTDKIAEHGYIIVPGRYVGVPPLKEPDEPFEERMARMRKDLEKHFAKSQKLQKEIRKNLEDLDFEL